MACPSNEELIQQFERAAEEAPSLQLLTLSSILSRNASSLYLQSHGLATHGGDVASFRQRIPLVCYEDLEHHIQRIADGDSSPLLCSDPVILLLLSSGTSAGKSKLIPATQGSVQITRERFSISNAYLNRTFSVDPMGKNLSFIYAGKLQTTKGGFMVGSASAHHLRSGNLSSRLPPWTSPLAVVLGSDICQSMYCHLICGLIHHREVSIVSSFYAYGITEAFRMLEGAWEELCTDIRNGTLSHRIKEESVRQGVLQVLHPNPELADWIEGKCTKKCWSGIIATLWPNAKYVHCIMTGSMETYVPYLKHYAGHLPLVNGDYGSSECAIGMNLNPSCPPDKISFTLMPQAAYFEFLPIKHRVGEEDNNIDKELLLDITSVKVGEEYELVVTTFSGLYRYRLGDIVRVTGFHHKTPNLAYISRRNVLLSINTDKTDERELNLVVRKASQLLQSYNMEVVDFTSYADHSSRPGFYVIFWELRCMDMKDALLRKCCIMLDRSFNDPYRRGRAAGSIGPLRLCIVREGTFLRVLQLSIESGVSATQYKTPRCINSPKVLMLMEDSIVQEFRAPCICMDINIISDLPSAQVSDPKCTA